MRGGGGGLPADALVDEPEVGHALRVEEVPTVNDRWMREDGLQLLQIQLPELVPLGA